MDALDWKLVVAICSIVFGMFSFAWNQRSKRKELSYDFTLTQLKELGGIHSDLLLTFKGEPVSDVSLVVLTIRNSGSVPITKSDFEGGLVVAFDAGRGLSADRSTCIPEELYPTWTFVEESLQINSLLLNPGDSLGFSILATNFKSLQVLGRIAGVQRIMRKPLSAQPKKIGLIYLAAASGGFAVAASTSKLARESRFFTANQELDILINVVLFVVLMVVAFRGRFSKLK